MYPSAVDPAGLLMLKSIREIFDTANIQFESILFIDEEIIGPNHMTSCISNHKKAPVVTAIRFCPPMTSFAACHAMVATGIKTEVIGNQTKQFVQCKNTYRDDPNTPGTFRTFETS